MRFDRLMPRRHALHLGPDGVRAWDLSERRTLGHWPDLDVARVALAARRSPRWRGDTVEALLSDGLCRYLVLPRPAGLRSRAELLGAVQGRFQSLFGNGRWELRVASPLTSPSGGGAGAVHASAVANDAVVEDFAVGTDGAELARLLACCDAAGWRLTHARPQWLAWADRWASSLARGAHWLVSADERSIAIGYVVDGRCRLARTLRRDELPLETLLARESALLDEHDPGAAVWVAGHGPALARHRETAVHQVAQGAWWGLGEAGA